MNVRITPRGWPNRTDVYSTGVPLMVGPDDATASVPTLTIWTRTGLVSLPLWSVAEIELDEEGAVT